MEHQYPHSKFHIPGQFAFEMTLANNERFSDAIQYAKPFVNVSYMQVLRVRDNVPMKDCDFIAPNEEYVLTYNIRESLENTERKYMQELENRKLNFHLALNSLLGK